MKPPRTDPKPLEYWREPPIVRREMTHWQGVLTVLLIVSAPLVLWLLLVLLHGA